jgi:hypothetical protein
MATLSFEHLFKLRLVVARYGEMDGAKWWNTQGVLGRYGAMALGRGFPRTHRFAQAGIAFSVAAHRCREVYDAPAALTLWNLPAETEDRFREKWHDWMEAPDAWADFFKGLEGIAGEPLLDCLAERGLISGDQMKSVEKLRRSDGGHSVPLPVGTNMDDAALTLLAAGFAKGEPGKPAVPYFSVADTTG